MVAGGAARRRWLLLALAAAGCAGPGGHEQRSLRAVLLDPVASRAERSRLLAEEVAAGGEVRPGARLALVHHSLRAGEPVDAASLLDAEAAAFPASARFLARYRALLHVPGEPKATPAAGGGALLVLPPVDQTRQRSVVADLLAGLAPPLVARGWWVVPVEVGLEVVAMLGGPFATIGHGIPEAATVRRLAAELGVDACLLLHVVDWRAHEALVVEALDHDVRYTLFDGASGEACWQRTAAGHYYRREPAVTFTPHEDDPPFYYPGSLGPVFDDQFEFARALHRAVLVTLPRGRE